MRRTRIFILAFGKELAEGKLGIFLFELQQHDRFEVMAKWGIHGQRGHFRVGACEFVTTHFRSQRFESSAGRGEIEPHPLVVVKKNDGVPISGSIYPIAGGLVFRFCSSHFALHLRAHRTGAHRLSAIAFVLKNRSAAVILDLFRKRKIVLLQSAVRAT